MYLADVFTVPAEPRGPARGLGAGGLHGRRPARRHAARRSRRLRAASLRARARRRESLRGRGRGAPGRGELSGRRALAAAAVAALLFRAVPSLSAAAPRRVEVSRDFAVELRDGAITVEARPLEGETPVAVRPPPREGRARRRSASSRCRGARGARGRDALVRRALADETRRAAVQALFPSDVRATAAWLHIAVEEETLASSRSGSRATPARAARPRDARTRSRAGRRAARRDRPDSRRVPRAAVPGRRAHARRPSRRTSSSARTRRAAYAMYRLRKGEALYSAVVVRFTGRLDAADVNDLALKIAQRSGIADVHAIPVGFPVKIPVEFLSEEFLPKDDPALPRAGAGEGRDGAVRAARGRPRPRGRARDPRRGPRRARHGDAPRRRLGGDVRLRRRVPPPEGPVGEDARRGPHDDEGRRDRLDGAGPGPAAPAPRPDAPHAAAVRAWTIPRSA